MMTRVVRIGENNIFLPRNELYYHNLSRIEFSCFNVIISICLAKKQPFLHHAISMIVSLLSDK